MTARPLGRFAPSYTRTGSGTVMPITGRASPRCGWEESRCSCSCRRDRVRAATEINLASEGEKRMMRKLIAGLFAACLLVGVGTAFAWDAEGEKNAQAAIAEFKRADPSIDAFFQKAYGYAIFPEITK